MAQDFTDTLTRKWPHDPDKGFYAQPNLPAVRAGKAMMKYTGIASAGDIVGLHEYGGLFGGGTLAATGTHLYHPDGKLAWEDLQRATHERDKVQLSVNQTGKPATLTLKTDSLNAARLLVNALDAVIYAPKADDLLEEERQYDHLADLSQAEIDWLKLRDEIMRTIDQLHQRFQDGKLSLLEYDEKKQELLSRL